MLLPWWVSTGLAGVKLAYNLQKTNENQNKGGKGEGSGSFFFFYLALVHRSLKLLAGAAAWRSSWKLFGAVLAVVWCCFSCCSVAVLEKNKWVLVVLCELLVGAYWSSGGELIWMKKNGAFGGRLAVVSGRDSVVGWSVLNCLFNKGGGWFMAAGKGRKMSGFGGGRESIF
uniref:Transmembrane protein n=1 Tax=Solanum tuberosum TaxID=4113 RepID=M1CNY0_SOLTU